MRNVYKWRIKSNKYLYITDETQGYPFIYNKITTERIYPNSSVTIQQVNEEPIKEYVSSIDDLSAYCNMFNLMVNFAKSEDPDASKLNFLPCSNYFNLDNSECVQEAITPKCEGYEPIVSVSSYTLPAGSDAECYLETTRNEQTKTINYSLSLGIPKGETGEQGEPGIGCKGTPGPAGKDSVITAVTANAVTLYPDEAATATVDIYKTTTETENQYGFDFTFGIPKGEDGESGGGGGTYEDGHRYNPQVDSLSEGIETEFKVGSEDYIYALPVAAGIRSHAEGIGASSELVNDYVQINLYGYNNVTITFPANVDTSRTEVEYTYGNLKDTEDEHYDLVVYGGTWNDNVLTVADGFELLKGGTDYNTPQNFPTFFNPKSYNREIYIINDNVRNAIGVASHTEGFACQASGNYSHAEGQNTLAEGTAGHAEGIGTIAGGVGGHAEGTYNKRNRTTLHSVGIGTSDSNRLNAFEIMQSGDVYVKGIGGYDGTNAGASGVQTLQAVIDDIYSRL